jgi:hypothetical protein
MPYPSQAPSRVEDPAVNVPVMVSVPPNNNIRETEEEGENRGGRREEKRGEERRREERREKREERRPRAMDETEEE